MCKMLGGDTKANLQAVLKEKNVALRGSNL